MTAPLRVARCLAWVVAGWLGSSWLLVGGALIGWAGGGPENVLLVVNRDSADSMTIANHYIELRCIPPGNVLSISWNPTWQTTDVETFRERILRVVLETIEQRKLADQIDYVVYSADFPWRIDLRKDVERFLEEARRSAASAAAPGEAAPGEAKPDGPANPPKVEPKWPEFLAPEGSLNGLTYLYQPVMARSAVAMDLRANAYMRLPVPGQRDTPSRGFRSTDQFGPNGEVTKGPGRRYLLSVVLGVTYGRGNRPEEILDYLRRSASADGTMPKGTIYFVQNNDIRSKVRHPMFPDVVRQLRALGVAAEIIEGIAPLGKDDVQGCVMGTATFDWKHSASTILPGAICDHFTSFGGVMEPKSSQTPLSEFLRHGAAGASGTVTEPRAILNKFPTPTVQLHYARGCSLAEAFYQSVYGPYQLMIVGDPLCRPWANIPRVSVSGVEQGAKLSGKVTLRPEAQFPRPAEVDHFAWFVDGVRRGRCAAGETFTLDTATLADGYHELRVVAVEAGPIQTQGHCILAVTTANHGATIEAAVNPSGKLSADKPLVVSAASPGAIGIAVLHNSRLLGRIAGAQGTLEIDPRILGFGPVQLRVVSLGKGSPLSYAFAPPLKIEIERP